MGHIVKYVRWRSQPTICPVQVLVRWKSKLHLGTFWVLKASGKRWRTQTFMLRVRLVTAMGCLRSVSPFPSLRRSQGRALLRMLRKSTTNVQRKYDLAQLEVNIVWGRGEGGQLTTHIWLLMRFVFVVYSLAETSSAKSNVL